MAPLLTTLLTVTCVSGTSLLALPDMFGSQKIAERIDEASECIACRHLCCFFSKCGKSECPECHVRAPLCPHSCQCHLYTAGTAKKLLLNIESIAEDDDLLSLMDSLNGTSNMVNNTRSDQLSSDEVSSDQSTSGEMTVTTESDFRPVEPAADYEEEKQQQCGAAECGLACGAHQFCANTGQRCTDYPCCDAVKCI